MSDDLTRKARLAQAETVLRSHPTWGSEMVAQFCKLSEQEVDEVRARLLARSA